MRTPRPALRCAQSGRTIVELMIAAGVGLAVVASMVGGYVGASRTARVSTEMSGIADVGQVTLLMIGNAMRQAGYGEIVGSDPVLGANQGDAYRTQTLFADGVSLFGCSGARFVDDTLATPACNAVTDANFDSVMVRYQGDTMIPPAQGALADCLGTAVPLQPLPAGHVGLARTPDRPIVQNAYYGATGAVWCRGNGRAQVADAFAAAQQLVGNVEQFKVFYGFDDLRYANPNATVPPSARSVRDAAWINALPAASMPWDFVVSVQMCMLVRSGTADSREVSAQASVTYARCPLNVAEAAGALPTATATDRAIRRAYTQVVAVRSQSAANPLQSLP